MGRREETEIAPDRPVSAHRGNLAVLQHTQQLDLKRQGDVGHFVQEKRAAVGLLQEPFAGVLGAGEGPAACPNSSLSASDGLSEATLTATNGPSARRL